MRKVHETFRYSQENKEKAMKLAAKDKRKLCHWIEIAVEEKIERDSKKKK